MNIKLKFSDFSQITRGKTLRQPISSSNAIFDHAMDLFSEVTLKKKIRLVGVGVSDLQDPSRPVQRSFI